MSRLRPTPALACLAVAAALLCAPGAAAAPPPGPSVPPKLLQLSRSLGLPWPALLPMDVGSSLGQAEFGSRTLVLVLRGRDGYTITVTGFGQTVVLAVSQNRLPAVTTYLAHGKVGADSIDARFADLGRIAVRFRPSGAVKRSGSGGCGRRVIARFGTFVGELSFSGEGGYTSVHVHRASGALFLPPARTPCRRVARPRPPRLRAPGARPAAAGRRAAEEKVTWLTADWRQPLARTAFAALTLGGRLTFFLAVSEASEGSIAVVREALTLTDAPNFSVDDTLASAAVSPPPPFSGSGSFQHLADGSTSWTGSLAVSFPGAPDVSLTGPQFAASLEREW